MKDDTTYQKPFFDPGVPTIVLYDSEINVVEGQEHLQHMKLSKKTENRRIYTTCCGTPLGISADHSHLNLIYCPVVKPLDFLDCDKDKNEIPFPHEVLEQPSMCVLASRLDLDDQNDGANDFADVYKTKYPNMKYIKDHFAPKEILKVAGRLLLLIGMGTRGPGKGFVIDDKEIGIGYESISMTNSNSTEKKETEK